MLQNLKMIIILTLIKHHSSTTCTVSHLSMSQCCPLLPRYPPHCSCTAIRFVVYISMTETGTVVDWFLCHMAVLHISKCTTADINCCGLVVMQYGGSTHQ